MHSGMVARFMFHEYIDHTYLPHPGGGFSVARKTLFLLVTSHCRDLSQPSKSDPF